MYEQLLEEMRHQQPVITREVASKIIYLFMKFEEVLLDLDLNFTQNTAGFVMSVNPESLLLSPIKEPYDGKFCR